MIARLHLQEAFDQLQVLNKPVDLVIPNKFPPSMNKIRNQHFWWARKHKGEFTDAIFELAVTQGLRAYDKAFVQMRLFFPDRRRRDMDNYTPKYLLDGLVRAKVVPDDTPQYVFVLPTLLGYDKENPRTVLRLYRSAPFIMAKGVMDDGGEERTGEAVAAGARH